MPGILSTFSVILKKLQKTGDYLLFFLIALKVVTAEKSLLACSFLQRESGRGFWHTGSPLSFKSVLRFRELSPCAQGLQDENHSRFSLQQAMLGFYWPWKLGFL